MTPAEFYETYYRIQQADGTTATPKLSDEERRLWDKAFEMNEPPYVIYRGRKGTRFEVNPKVKQALIAM